MGSFSGFQALSCVVDIPDVSVCELLDQLIALFCFYNGPVRQSYQVQHQSTVLYPLIVRLGFNINILGFFLWNI